MRIYQYEYQDVVLCTQMPNDQGVEITSYAQAFAAAVAQQYNLDPMRLTWVEHYDRRGNTQAGFDAVRFDWHGGQARFPDWRRLTYREMVQLAGETESTREETLPLV